jgi:hypothetical protein
MMVDANYEYGCYSHNYSINTLCIKLVPNVLRYDNLTIIRYVLCSSTAQVMKELI